MISVVVPCSVIPSHPDTAILDETLDSIRFHLPESEIFVTFDGIREEQQDRTDAYEEFIRRALWRLDKHYKNCVPYIMDRHQHQTGMMRHILDDITTPLMMYVESDTPLVTDEPIDWDSVIAWLLGGDSHLIRMHHEAQIPADHEHMMVGNNFGGYIGTCQWSQRPHVASTAFYRRVLDCFTPDAKAFIEDRMHSVCHEAYKLDGILGWEQWKLHIYAKDPNNLKRSYHTDGRAGEPKWDSSQTF